MDLSLSRWFGTAASDRVTGRVAQAARQCSRFGRAWIGRPYLAMIASVWSNLPVLQASVLGHACGLHLHHLICLRGRSTSPPKTTFFFRNRPMLELLIRNLSQKPPGA